ncbi:hypothetical protein [uncultured Desulfovibrio sp.]|uniref:hypothetical protein n=1 Tax=uncultured Desulfovibrio sp. TaxID=167968 RepID=UPI00272C60DA|nr:hypothetical protein [uncultured Desulfovibrio sp.]
MDMYGNYPPEIMALPIRDRANLWICCGETGISSKTIWAVLSDIPFQKNPFEKSWRFYFDVPHDPGDFRRCYLLLQLIPEWKHWLGEVAGHFPAWKKFVENWDELTELYERERENPDGNAPLLYARMKELLN